MKPSCSKNDISTPVAKGYVVSKTYSEVINSEWEVALIRVSVMLQKALDKSMIQAD